MSAPTRSEVWAGLRAIYEGAALSFALLGKAGCLTEDSVAQRARREGWIAGGGERAKQQRRLQGQITRLDNQIERLIGEAEEGEGFDKARIDLLTALLRSVEKLREMMPAIDNEQDVKERDARIGKILHRVHAHVEELARRIGLAEAEAHAGRS
jgi:hypothetical protein